MRVIAKPAESRMLEITIEIPKFTVTMTRDEFDPDGSLPSWTLLAVGDAIKLEAGDSFKEFAKIWYLADAKAWKEAHDNSTVTLNLA